MLDRLIELVFKYRPVVFGQGELGFSPPWPAAIAVIAVLAAMGAAVWVYSKSARTAGWSRAALLALRLSALAVFLFALLRPVLVVRTVEPQRNVLAVLVDGSRSMEIADLDDEAPQRVRPGGARPVGRAPRRPGAPVLGPRLRVRLDRAAGGRPCSDDILRHALVHRALAAAHGRGARRPAGLGHRARHRRRRHVARADGRRDSRR